MSENPYDPAATPPPPPPPPPPGAAPVQQAQYGAPAMAPGAGQPGKIRSTGISILLFIVTFGIYGWFYYYYVHEEMKRHKGDGLGGPIALILALFVGIVMPYLTSNEVGELYARRGQQKPVSGLTGLWYFPGMFILVGPIIWFVKTNGALNDYWASLGVTKQ
jgi:hypothetical protein